jgi:glutamyl-tRNA(Gln) amidotransferase subunit E
MYPETDVPPVVVTPEYVSSLKLPELFDERTARFEEEYGLNREFAGLIASSPNYQLFEEAARDLTLPPALVVRTLEMIPRELAREGVPISNLTEERYLDLLSLVSEGGVAKEGIPQLLETMAKNPELSASDAAKAAGLAGLDQGGVEGVVVGIVAEKEAFVRERGEAALGPLMGLAMKELRGKADGALISSILKREIERLLAE